jgi:hypothetical protein
LSDGGARHARTVDVDKTESSARAIVPQVGAAFGHGGDHLIVDSRAPRDVQARQRQPRPIRHFTCTTRPSDHTHTHTHDTHDTHAHYNDGTHT